MTISSSAEKILKSQHPFCMIVINKVGIIRWVVQYSLWRLLASHLWKQRTGLLSLTLNQNKLQMHRCIRLNVKKGKLMQVLEENMWDFPK